MYWTQDIYEKGQTMLLQIKKMLPIKGQAHFYTTK
jgi:hypothetical protein